MRLRPATNADRDEVKALVYTVLDEYGMTPDRDGYDRGLEDLQAYYREPGGLFDVLVAGSADGAERIVGTVGLRPQANGVVELQKMYLAREARGRGHGRRLLEHALECARELGFTRCELSTAAVLVEAIGLYQRYGFEPFGEVPATARCDRQYGLDL